MTAASSRRSEAEVMREVEEMLDESRRRARRLWGREPWWMRRTAEEPKKAVKSILHWPRHWLSATVRFAIWQLPERPPMTHLIKWVHQGNGPGEASTSRGPTQESEPPMPEQRNSDDALLSMEWPDSERYESRSDYNDRTGRDLTVDEYERLRRLTHALAPRTRTNKRDTMTGISRMLGG